MARREGRAMGMGMGASGDGDGEERNYEVRAGRSGEFFLLYG